MKIPFEFTKSKMVASLSIIISLAVLSGVLVAIVDPMLTSGKHEENFQLVCEVRSIAGDTPVYKFKSLKTGLHVIIAKVEGPIVQGFFTIATEATDDDGLPHTLEHLVFLGSEDYPYKGVLDQLANRCLAEGTNAWTDSDHTAYTVMTAGSGGFLNLLPIYLDHLLYPTNTDAGFVTEVHHITGQGNDAGVVYSEMQARENTGPELTYTKLIRVLYPEPSGYHYETGGMLANLRDKTTIEKIRKYHRAMYRPENLHVIITGQVEPKEVFQALESFEDKIVSKGERGPFERPWQSPVPPFNESQEINLVYPSDSEDTGIVRVGWRGPSIITDLTEFQSMEILMKYLTEVSISPLPKVFVEIEDPLASSVEEYMLRNSISSCTLSFSGVTLDKINDVVPLLMDTLTKIMNGDIPFDLEIMKTTIKNLILKEESLLETSPHSTFAQYIIHDLLYGLTCEDLNKEINQIEWFEHLLTEPSSYWINLLKKYFIDAPSVVVKGIPSVSEANRLQEEDVRRVLKRKEYLGENGLKKLEEKVHHADRVNEIPPPESMLESVPVPSISKINFHSLKVFTNVVNHSSGFIQKPDPSLFNLDIVNVKMQLDEVKSNFVQLVAILDARSLTQQDRMYIPLVLDLILESNIIKNHTEMHYEEVVKHLNADTLKAETFNGLYLKTSSFIYGPHFQNVGINMEVEMGKYEKGVEWLSDVLFRVVFNAERVQVKANKLLNSIGDKKREANTILRMMFNDVVFNSDTNANAANILKQEKFLTQVLVKLKNNPSEILNNLNNVYKNITSIDNIVIHLATKFKKLSTLTNTTQPWVNFAPNGFKRANMNLNIHHDWEEKISFRGDGNTTSAFITGMASIESAYLLQTTSAITSYTDEDLPALMTAISYLTQLEGPMWKRIRGKGLAYSYVINLKPHEGTLTLKLARAAQLIEAYKEASKIINSHLDGTEPWNRLLFESARSSLIYEIIEREAEISDVVQQSIYAYYRKVPHDYNRSLLRAIDKVTTEDLSKVASKYFKPMIDPKFSKTVIVCPSTKVEEVGAELTRLGHSVSVSKLLDHNTTSLLDF